VPDRSHIRPNILGVSILNPSYSAVWCSPGLSEITAACYLYNSSYMMQALLLHAKKLYRGLTFDFQMYHPVRGLSHETALFKGLVFGQFRNWRRLATTPVGGLYALRRR
jgi:hypothetical protein